MRFFKIFILRSNLHFTLFCIINRFLFRFPYLPISFSVFPTALTVYNLSLSGSVPALPVVVDFCISMYVQSIVFLFWWFLKYGFYTLFLAFCFSFVSTLQVMLYFVGAKNICNIFLSSINILFVSFILSGQVSDSYNITGRIKVVYSYTYCFFICCLQWSCS